MTENQTQSINLIRSYIEKAEKIYKKNFSMPKVKWNLRGTTAGKASLSRWEIHLHPVLVESEGEKYINRTPGHEVAHLITFSVYGRVKPHGREWKSVMLILGLDPKRCHNYDVSEVRQDRSKLSRCFEYSCNCRTHHMTQIRHRRSLMGAKYKCCHCNSILKFVDI